MKKIISSILAMAVTAAVFASGVENKTNLNQGYIRNPSRNAENERPEAAFYNIAGTAFIPDGFYLEAGNQIVIKDYANELVTGNEYAGVGVNDYKANDNDPAYLYPDFDVVYKKGSLAFFGTFGIYAGGGHLFYEKGTSATSLMFLNGANQYKYSATQHTLAAGAAQSTIESAISSVKQGIGLQMGIDPSLVPEDNAWAYIRSFTVTDPTSDVQKAQYESFQKVIYIKDNVLANEAKLATNDTKIATASLALAQNHSLDVTSITYGGQIGLAFRPWDWISFSGAYRYTYGTQTMKLKYKGPENLGTESQPVSFKMLNGGYNNVSYDAHGFGQSMVFGIHAKPRDVEGLDVAIQYQTLSRIDYDVEHVTGETAQFYNITDETTFRTDLPAVFNLGLGYKVTDSLYLSSSFNYYFNDFAHQDNILATTDYDNSWEIAAGVDWKICKYIGASCGASYGHQGITDTSNSTFNPVLNNVVVGGGFEIYPTEDLTVTAGCLYANYKDADYYLGGEKKSSTRTTLSKKVTNMAIGVTYHFPVK